MTLNIGGYIPSSFVDYPGKVAAVVFVNGCNLRCSYCHNQHLLNSLTTVPEAEVLEFLAARVGKLTAVVISGGEPTQQPDALINFCTQVKKLGYLIKLDTNGSSHITLLELLFNKLIDTVALDVKLPVDRYYEVGGDARDITRILRILNNFDCQLEVRTTVVKGMHTYEDLMHIFDWIRPYASCWWLQAFKPAATVLNPKYDCSYIPEHEMLVQVADHANSLGLVTRIR